jgi:signal transduction histidine kinase
MTRLPFHPRTRDFLIAGGMYAAVVFELLLTPNLHNGLALNLALYAVLCGALIWRRTHPIATLAAVITMTAVSSAVAEGVTELATTVIIVVLATYAAGHEATGRRMWWGVALIPVGTVAVNVASDQTAFGDFLFPIMLMGVAFTVGYLVRSRSELARELAARADELRGEREVHEAEAVSQERRRIARELHDVVAHTVSVMVVQSGAARRTLDRDTGRALEALETVEDTGRLALAELRRLLGFLREDGEAPDFAPQPGMGDIGDLVRRARDMGMRVGFETHGEPGPLPAGAELAAYRVVQEALTNAMKHAGDAHISVGIRWVPDAVEIEVRNTGRPGAWVVPAVPGSGHGLVGMRERVALYGGELHAGPHPRGGFEVRARIPRIPVEARIA